MSMSSVYQNEYPDIDAVMKILEKKIDRSSELILSCGVNEESYLRHTAIVVGLDGIPSFTIDFRIEDGTFLPTAVFKDAEPKITIEPVDQESIRPFCPFGHISLETPNEKKLAVKRVREILDVHPGKYNLFFSNCRDHVKAVVKHITGRELSYFDIAGEMSQLLQQDVGFTIGGGLLIVVVLVFVVLLVAASMAVGRRVFYRDTENKHLVLGPGFPPF